MKRLILILGILFSAFPAHAYDKAGHYVALYAAARDAGFSKEEAHLIGSSSQSLDENDSTTAFAVPKVAAELRDLAHGAVNLELAKTYRDLPHMINGQTFHALTSPENRQIVEQFHLRRIRELWTNPTLAGTAQQSRQRQLIYLGQYLHLVADEVTHPYDPLLGHALEGATPDHVDHDAHKLRTMMALMHHKLVEFKRGEISLTQPSELENPVAPLSPRMAQVAVAVERVWQLDASMVLHREFRQKLGKMLDERDFDIIHMYDSERSANAAHRVRQALGGDYVPFQKIVLDQNGDPIETAENLSRFGTVRSIENLSSTAILAHNEDLESERNDTIVNLARTGFQKVTAASAGSVQALAKTWLPPSSPGGIALDPELTMPDGIGELTRVTFDEHHIILVTESGPYPVAGLNPRTMATVLRVVAAGQNPYLSIGTEPSDRKGYARVTYAPLLRGTREGAIMFRADIQFKAIFGGLPFGRDYVLNVQGDKIAGGFPGHGGEYTRMWITAAQIKLELKNGRLQTTEKGHGMRIFGETTLMNDVVEDPTMDAYTKKLTDNWRQLAEQILEYAMLERIAVATGLAFYIRKHEIPIDPVLLSLPSKEDHTPDYVPLLAMEGKHRGVTGGVALTPEEKATSAGRNFLFTYSPMFLPQPGPNGEPDVRPNWLQNRWRFIPLCLAVLVIGALVTGLPAWLFACLGIARINTRLPLWSFLMKVWVLALLTQGLLAMITLPITSAGWLSSFDRDLAAFLVTWLAGPAALLLWTQVYLGSKGWWYCFSKSRMLLTVYGLMIPVTTAAMSIVAALLTISVTGVVPGPVGEYLLTAELAPVNVASQAVAVAGVTAKGKFVTMPVPRSLMQTARPRFEYDAQPEEVGDGKLLRWLGPIHPTKPFEKLYRVRWPENTPLPEKTRYYSTDGSPP